MCRRGGQLHDRRLSGRLLMTVLGYARVSTAHQSVDMQVGVSGPSGAKPTSAPPEMGVVIGRGYADSVM